jgi:hypothetical protein
MLKPTLHFTNARTLGLPFRPPSTKASWDFEHYEPLYWASCFLLPSSRANMHPIHYSSLAKYYSPWLKTRLTREGACDWEVCKEVGTRWGIVANPTARLSLGNSLPKHASESSLLNFTSCAQRCKQSHKVELDISWCLPMLTQRLNLPESHAEP